MRKFAPGREKSGAFGNSVVEDDGELMGLKRMKLAVRIGCGPPLKGTARKPPDAKPEAMAVEGQDPKSGAAPISKDERGPIVRIGLQSMTA